MAELIEGEEFGIHHIAGGGSASWFDFAQEIFDQADVDCRVLAGQPARRSSSDPSIGAVDGITLMLVDAVDTKLSATETDNDAVEAPAVGLCDHRGRVGAALRARARIFGNPSHFYPANTCARPPWP